MSYVLTYMLTYVEVDPLLYLVMSYIVTDMLTDVEVDPLFYLVKCVMFSQIC
jgi:hypothetical protein